MLNVWGRLIGHSKILKTCPPVVERAIADQTAWLELKICYTLGVAWLSTLGVACSIACSFGPAFAARLVLLVLCKTDFLEGTRLLARAMTLLSLLLIACLIRSWVDWIPWLHRWRYWQCGWGVWLLPLCWDSSRVDYQMYSADLFWRKSPYASSLCGLPIHFHGLSTGTGSSKCGDQTTSTRSLGYMSLVVL